jgi:hypothetical protein
MRVALVHDWLNGMLGGEKILEFCSAPLRVRYERIKVHTCISMICVHL